MPTAKKTPTKKRAQRADGAREFDSFPGLLDVLPKEGGLWREVRQAFFSAGEIHAFHYIETALIERKSTFAACEREFNDRLDNLIFTSQKTGAAVRSEGMAPLLRTYAEHHLGHFSLPLKVHYLMEVVRKNGKHAGVNVHEVGFHVLGDPEPFYDIQVLSAAVDFLRSLKVKDVVIRVNANGCRNCRASYREKLKKYLSSRRDEFRVSEYRRLEKNPEEIFSMSGERHARVIEEAPTILDYLCQNCNNHFKALLELLEDNEMPYEPCPYLLLSVERWNRVVFEITTPGARTPLFYGGRYDHLSESIAGRQIPAVGIISTVEDLIRYIREQGIYLRPRERAKVFFIVIGDKAKRTSVRLMGHLRGSGVIVEEALGKQSFKAQLKMAEKSHAALILIVGQKEAFEETVIVRNVASGAQETIVTLNLIEEVKRRLKM